ncbi:MAG: Crp/Fnr family transcriptional regulator [Bacteroidales bacterium]
MKTFIESIRHIHPVSDEGIQLLMQNLQEVSYRKGKFLIKENGNNRNIFFMKEGFARAFVIRDNKEFTLWFVQPFEPITTTLGTIAHPRSGVNVQLVEESTLLMISRKKMEELFLQSLELANWGRKFTDKFLLGTEDFFTKDLCTNASERYQRLVTEYPELLQKASLKHLASYLLVTPESLSRIRGKLKSR